MVHALQGLPLGFQGAVSSIGSPQDKPAERGGRGEGVRKREREGGREREIFPTAGMYRQIDTASRIWYNYNGHLQDEGGERERSFPPQGVSKLVFYAQSTGAFRSGRPPQGCTDKLTLSRIWYSYNGHFRTRAERERSFPPQGCIDQLTLLVGYGIIITATSGRGQRERERSFPPQGCTDKLTLRWYSYSRTTSGSGHRQTDRDLSLLRGCTYKLTLVLL